LVRLRRQRLSIFLALRQGFNHENEVDCMQKFLSFVLVLLSLCSGTAVAQKQFFDGWENRVRSTTAQQPAWAVPVFTSSSGLVQLARTDMIRQITSARTTTWNYGGSKGLNLIPWYRTEVDINLPPYIQHNNVKVKDGAGDLSLLLKYRVLAANEKQGGYSVSAALAATAPTGSYSNGAVSATVSPSLFLGKGYRSLDVQTAASIALPTGRTATLGRPVTWNTVIQEKVAKIFWPEVEVNSTYYRGGPNDGKIQAFVSPGLMISKIKFSSDPKNRLGLVIGAGEQIAFSKYHAYNHELSLTTRIVF
jgi:hypothetical protein